MTGFDLSVQKESGKVEDEGIFVHIRDLDDFPLYFPDPNNEGEELPVGITVTGSHSSRMREIEAIQRKRKLKAKNLTGQSIHDDGVEKVAYCSLSWQGIMDKGREVEFSRHNVRMIYTECPWVLDQVSEAMSDRALFSGNKSSL